MTGLGDLVAVAALALCLAAPEAAAATDKGSDPPDQNTVTSWTIIVGDPLETPQSGSSPPPAPAGQPPQIMPMPPPGDVLDAVTTLLLSCPKWQAGPTAGYETEAHVCQLLAGHDPAYVDRRVAGSWMTAAVLGGVWLVLRFPDRLASMLALVRRRRN